MTNSAPTGKRLRRDAGLIGLLYFSLGGMIGSGWLFGALVAAREAGPWSIISWIIGAVCIVLLALVFAELATMLPRSGALIHISHLSHGDLVGRIWAWILFLSSVTTPPIEVLAVITYASNYIPNLVEPSTSVLTTEGFFVAIALLALIVGINFIAIKVVLAVNNAATWWKLLIPTATIVILISLSFHPGNFTLHLADTHPAGMLTAVSTAGIVFSFLGFRLAINLGGESRNPGRYIPIAVIGSVLIATIIYVGLQVAFLGALRPSDVVHGWAAMTFKGIAGPLAALAAAAGAVWWGTLLYVDAIISPMGTGLVYSANTSRLGMAMGEMGSAPAPFKRLSRAGVPWIALIATFVIGAVFFFPFPSWSKLVGYVSSVTVLSFSIGPIVLLKLRQNLPQAKRPFRLWGAWVLCPLAFIASDWIVFWTGFATDNILFELLLAIFILYLLWHHLVRRRSVRSFGWQYFWWVIPYFFGLWIFSRIGPARLGGDGVLDLGWDMLVIAAFSLIIMVFAMLSALPPKDMLNKFKRVSEIELPPDIEA